MNSNYTKLQKGIKIISMVKAYSRHGCIVSNEDVAFALGCTSRYVTDIVREIKEVDSNFVTIRGRNGGYIYKSLYDESL